MTSQDAGTTVIVGVDVGSESTKVVLGPRHGCEIVRNDVGGHTTPTVVSLSGDTPKQPRQLGTKSSAKNAVYHLNRLFPDEVPSDDLLQPFYPFSYTSGTIEGLEYNGEAQAFSTTALLGMLLGKLQQNVKATLQRQQGQDNDCSISLSLSCPLDMSESCRQEILDAAFAAGIDSVQLVDRSVTYQATYSRKFPEHLDKYVLIVDMGHADTTMSILGPSKKEDEEEKEEKGDEVAFMTVLATQRHKGLGAGVVDVRLWNHFQSTNAALNSLTPTSRGGQRLLAGMSKLKHLLSQLPEASVTVENVGQQDADVNLQATRSLLVELCKDEVQALTAMVDQVLAKAGIGASQLHSVEVVGGGCRMPWVKEILEKATQMTLSHTLDDTSAALGAALMGEEATPLGILARRTPEMEPTERQIALRQAEAKMAALDAELQMRSAILNQMEAHILGLRSAKNEKHGDLLPEELFTYLDTLEDWIFSPEADDSGYGALQAKWKETKDRTDELSKAYTEAITSDRKASEAEMEAEAKLAQKEREGEDNGDEEDHDNRRLPKKRRMEIVMKNKNEGGELFADGNFKFAAARYAKALSHCAKFIDLSPDDLEEVNAVKLTLNLNLALAYLKMENPDQALRYCNDALALDENHSKALYRRASVYYEKKNWEGASKDLKKALKGAPDDKALQKLQEKVDAQIKRQKLKEKKMAQKMFG